MICNSGVVGFQSEMKVELLIFGVNRRLRKIESVRGLVCYLGVKFLNSGRKAEEIRRALFKSDPWRSDACNNSNSEELPSMKGCSVHKGSDVEKEAGGGQLVMNIC